MVSWRLGTKTTSGVLLLLVVITLLLSVGFIYQDVSPVRVFQRISQGIQSGGPYDNSSDDVQRYEVMARMYMDTLTSIRPHQYGSVHSYLDIGPPVSSVRNVSGDPSPQPKLILLWTPFFGKTNWVDESSIYGCPVPCQISTNKNDFPRADALVMHPRDLPKGNKSLPKKHLPWQRWVYLVQESPFHIGIDPKDFENVFNWTATIRRDSDIYLAYDRMVRRRVPMERATLEKMVSDIVKTKTKLVAARISNCDKSKTNRLKYIAELKQYISVDVYGRCGDKTLPRGEEADELMKKYKFYLSFENSNCRDYITEKFWLPFWEWRSVPIVMGAAPEDYLASAPNEAFIHTDGFKSPKDMAEYLQLLDRNMHLYERFFTWHKDWERESGPPWACTICKRLHNSSLPVQSYRDFKGWYGAEYCKF